jgi:hypothetical protein
MTNLELKEKIQREFELSSSKGDFPTMDLCLDALDGETKALVSIMEMLRTKKQSEKVTL